MAALLVAIAILTIMMSVAMPVWRHDAQREKEAELVWRGNQYVRAIRLFQAKTRTFPTSVDMLVQGRFLRQKYLDPITNQEFVYIGAGSAAAQPGGGVTSSFTLSTANARGGAPAGGIIAQPPNGQSASFAAPATASSVPGGLIGVQSKSTDESIMVYGGRTHYNEWVFLYVAQNPGVPGGRGPNGLPNGRGGRGGRGGPGGQNGPGGRGIRGGPGGNAFPFPFPPAGGRGRGRGGGI